MACLVAVAGLLLLLLGCMSQSPEGKDDSHVLHMANVIRVVEELENRLPNASNLQVVQLFQQAGDSSEDHRHLLPTEAKLPLQESDLRFITQIMTHTVEDAVEHGVVLTPDGTTVALTPLIAGLESGLKKCHEVTTFTPKHGPFQGGQAAQQIHQPVHSRPSGEEEHPAVGAEKPSQKSDSPLSHGGPECMNRLDHLYLATVAEPLVLSHLQFYRKESLNLMGPDGCWDSVSQPQVFTLEGPPSHLTNAFLNGALDGVILGNHVMQEKNPAVKLSLLLKAYYNGKGVDGQEKNKSNFRRQQFLAVSDLGRLEEQVKRMLKMYKDQEGKVAGHGQMDTGFFPDLPKKAVEAFRQHIGCPAVIPRCMWEAKPYRGTPALLSLPLEFVYIHHTYEPSKPCQSFPECAADMRSMQRFHQEDRGWDDIGYSFVVGSDGYMYEGRGWTWVGAHTKGYNSRGYGVSFIGDYTAQPPAESAMSLVRDHFLQCAVSAGHLLPQYRIYGHRQMGQTTCPGDALFGEIQTWQGSFQHTVGMLNELAQSAFRMVLTQALAAMLKRVQNHSYIPVGEQAIIDMKRWFYRLGHIPNVVSCIECTHMPIVPLKLHEEEYSNWKEL